jgi:tetratricopeptide (TPR) repeat protein
MRTRRHAILLVSSAAIMTSAAIVTSSSRVAALASVAMFASACVVAVRRSPVFPLHESIPRDADMFASGWSHLQRERFSEAAAAFRRVLETDAANADAEFYLGIALAGQDLHEHALPHYRQAAAARPLDAEIHLMLGRSLAATGDVFGASASIREALTLRPGLAAAERALEEIVSAQRTALSRAQRPLRVARRRTPRYTRRTMPESSQALQAGA